jgi:hypothetical protein
MAYPTFAERAHHITRHHAPKDLETGEKLDTVREAFAELIDKVAPAVPAGPDATTAANDIGAACQSVIAAIVRNQEE